MLRRIVTPDNSSYLGLGKNLLFTEFTSADDWHYEAPNFHSFFDLDADPGETRSFPPGAGFDSLRAALPRQTAEELPGLDPETERRLRALGYLH